MEKMFMSFKLFQVLSLYNNKIKNNLSGFDVTDSLKVVHDCEVEGK